MCLIMFNLKCCISDETNAVQLSETITCGMPKVANSDRSTSIAVEVDCDGTCLTSSHLE